MEYHVQQGAASWVLRHANVQGTDPAHDVAALIQRVCAGADEVHLNELHTDAQRTAAEAVPGWYTYGHGQIKVMWRAATFTHLSADYERANGGILHVTPERGDVNVLLGHKGTGEQHWGTTAHVVQHIEAGGKARVTGQITGQNARGKHHLYLIARSATAHVQTGIPYAHRNGKRINPRTDQPWATEEAVAHPAPLIGTGDINIDWKAEKGLAPSKRTSWFPYTLWPGFGITEAVPHDPKTGRVQGTHGARLIDRCWILNKV